MRILLAVIVGILLIGCDLDEGGPTDHDDLISSTLARRLPDLACLRVERYRNGDVVKFEVPESECREYLSTDPTGEGLQVTQG